MGIPDVSQELLFVADRTVPLSIHEPAGNQGVERGGIAIHLSFVPETFEYHQLAFAGIGLLRCYGDRARGYQDATRERTDHRVTRPHHPYVGRTCDDNNSAEHSRARKML